VEICVKFYAEIEKFPQILHFKVASTAHQIYHHKIYVFFYQSWHLFKLLMHKLMIN